MDRQQIALGFSGLLYHTPQDIIRLARRAEEGNYDSVWVAETRFVGEGFIPLAVLSAVTKRVKLGNAILGHTFARTPTLTAMSCATLDLFSGGRAILGIGPGAPYLLEKQGLKTGQRLLAMREYVRVVRSLLNGEELTWRGKTVEVKGVKLQVSPVQKRIPIFMGVSGPKMLELAGEIADGVVLNALTSPEYVRNAVTIVRDSAKRAGRISDEIMIAKDIELSMDRDHSKAIDFLKPLLADYFVNQPHTVRDSGMTKEDYLRIQSASRDLGLQGAAEAVPDSVVQNVNVAGTFDECVKKLEEYRKAGVELPIIFPRPPENAEAIIDAFSPADR